MVGYNFPLIKNETPRKRVKIVSDLEKIVDRIKQDFPNATIVLWGSFSYGEGNINEEENKITNQSDYDIYVILESLTQVISALKDTKLKNINSRLGLEHGSCVDLTVIWQPLLNFGLTPVSGKIIHGNPEVGKLMDENPISRRKLRISQLKKAYFMLIEALSENERLGPSLQNALIQGFRSFLGLKETKAEIHECWKDYFSLHHNLRMLDKYRKDLEPALSELIRSALMNKLNPDKIPFVITPKSIALTKEFLRGLFFQTKRTFLWIDYLQYVVHQVMNLKVPRLFVDPNKVMLRVSYHLSNVFLENGDIDRYELEKAKKILQTITQGKDIKGDRACFAWCKEKIRTLAFAYVHKVKQGKRL
jgi:hypothetical protein